MKRLATLGIALCFAGALTYAANLNGKLVDADCWSKSSQAAAPETANKSQKDVAQSCAPTAATKSFALEVSKGKIYKLDAEGNSKAAAAMQNGSFKADHDGDIHVTVSGTTEGENVKVDSINGRGGKG
jgi:hypothetical protein